MKYFNSVIIIAFALAAIAGCKQKISYTRDVQKRYNLTDSELDKLQYYLVNDVILYKGTKDGSTTLEGGEIVINEEEKSDKIIFRSGTKGILEKSISPNKISIRFENGDGRVLVFGSSSMKSRYTLQAEKWNPNGTGTLDYGGETYTTSKGSKNAYISVKLKKNRDSENSQRVVKGKKLK